MTRKEKYQSIQLSELPKEISDEFKLVLELSNNFEDNDKQVMQNFDDLYEIVEAAYPMAIVAPKKISEVVKANPSRIIVAKVAPTPAAKKKKKYSKPVLKKATESQIKASNLKKSEWPTPKYSVGEYVSYENGDMYKETWYGVIKKVIRAEKERDIRYRIDAYHKNMSDLANTNEVYQSQLKYIKKVTFELEKNNFEKKDKKPYTKPVLQKAITKSDIALLAEGPGTLIVKKNPFAKKAEPFKKGDYVKIVGLEKVMIDNQPNPYNGKIGGVLNYQSDDVRVFIPYLTGVMGEGFLEKNVQMSTKEAYDNQNRSASFSKKDAELAKKFAKAGKKAGAKKEVLKFEDGDHVKVIKYNWHMVVDKIVFNIDTKKYMIFLEPYKYAEKAGNPGSYSQDQLKKINFQANKTKSIKTKMADAGVKSGKKMADSKKKQAKYAVLLKKIASYKEQLKDNDAAKTKIAAMAAKQYAEIDKVKSLGRTKFEVDYEKAVALDKLYREFLTADKRKFKGIKDRAEGKGKVSKPKTLGKAKPKRKPAAKKTWFQRFIE